MTDWSMCVGVTAHLVVCVCVCVCESVCVCVTHAGAQAAWQARPPFGWLASRREHGRGRKWSLAAGSRKDWKSSSPAMNRHRDTKHGSQSSTMHRPWTQTAPRQLASPHLAVHPQHRLAAVSSLYKEECALLTNWHTGTQISKMLVHALACFLQEPHQPVFVKVASRYTSGSETKTAGLPSAIVCFSVVKNIEIQIKLILNIWNSFNTCFFAVWTLQSTPSAFSFLTGM